MFMPLTTGMVEGPLFRKTWHFTHASFGKVFICLSQLLKHSVSVENGLLYSRQGSLLWGKAGGQWQIQTQHWELNQVTCISYHLGNEVRCLSYHLGNLAEGQFFSYCFCFGFVWFWVFFFFFWLALTYGICFACGCYCVMFPSERTDRDWGLPFPWRVTSGTAFWLNVWSPARNLPTAEKSRECTGSRTLQEV